MATKHSIKSVLKVEIKDSFYYTFATVVTQLGYFLVIPLFWKVLTPSDYGIIAITEIIGRFLSILIGLSLEQSITRFYYQWPEEERKRRIGAIWLMNWLSSISLGSIAIVILYFLSPHLFPEVKFFPLILMGIVNTIFVSLTLIVQTAIRIKKLPKLYAIFQLTTFVSQIGLSIYLVLILKKGLLGYFYSLVISSFVSVLLSAAIMSTFSTICIRNAGIRDALRFSVPMIPSALIVSLTSIMDRFILNQFCSLQTLGIYSIAMKFASIITVLQTSLKLSYGPFFMKNIFKENGQEIIHRMMGFYIFPLFFGGLLISVLIDKVVYIINQQSYFGVIQYVPYLVIVVLIGSLNVFYANGIILSKKTHLLMYPAFLQLITLLTGYYFIPKYQVYGIIIAKLISVICFFFASIYISNKVYYINYNWRKLYLFFVTLLIGMTVYILFAPSDMFFSAIVSIVIIIFYLISSYFSLRLELRNKLGYSSEEAT